MCATLLAWLEFGIIDRQSLCIVHVMRSLAGAVKSSMRHPHVRDYCDGTEQGVRAMLDKYAELARWHVERLNTPTLEISYEHLIQAPQCLVSELARFLGVRDRRCIRQ
jgi:hypothetical protein